MAAFHPIWKGWEEPETAGMMWVLLEDWLCGPAWIHVLLWWWKL